MILAEMKRLTKAWGYSMQGFVGAWRSEAAFRLEALLALPLLLLSLWLPASGVGHALMIGSILLVLIVELVNTAIEAVVDRISDEIHPLAKLAKDVGSSAVWLALVNVAAVWTCVLLWRY